METRIKITLIFISFWLLLRAPTVPCKPNIWQDCANSIASSITTRCDVSLTLKVNNKAIQITPSNVSPNFIWSILLNNSITPSVIPWLWIVIPNICLICDSIIMTAEADVKPEITGVEMISVRKPELNENANVKSNVL